jgi:hypothetical protein
LARRPEGTSVRRYVSPAGKVVAVAWKGPVMPDLRQVLGPTSFDWELPFFHGLRICTAYAGNSTPAGPGPYLAY